MPQFVAHGADASTGAERTITFEADDDAPGARTFVANSQEVAAQKLAWQSARMRTALILTAICLTFASSSLADGIEGDSTKWCMSSAMLKVEAAEKAYADAAAPYFAMMWQREQAKSNDPNVKLALSGVETAQQKLNSESVSGTPGGPRRLCCVGESENTAGSVRGTVQANDE